jgi:palmitoyltransferase
MYANVPLIEKITLFWAIIPVYFVIFEVTFSMNYYVIFDENTSSFFKYISLIFFEPLSIMTIITHMKSMFTSPGYVPIPFKSNLVSNKLPQTNAFQKKERDDFYCNKCHNPRPPRSHHCKICKKCTLKMDHHCQWVANCVGYYNQKVFYQFLFYATVGDFFGFIFLMTRLSSCNFDIRAHIPAGVRIKSPLTLIYYMWEPIQILIGGLCGLAMTISIGTLFYKQTNMLLNNQTTIDKKMFENWNSGPYYQPNKMKSFSSVMGYSIFEWFSLSFNGNDPFYEKTDYYYNLESYD